MSEKQLPQTDTEWDALAQEKVDERAGIVRTQRDTHKAERAKLNEHYEKQFKKLKEYYETQIKKLHDQYGTQFKDANARLYTACMEYKRAIREARKDGRIVTDPLELVGMVQRNKPTDADVVAFLRHVADEADQTERSETNE